MYHYDILTQKLVSSFKGVAPGDYQKMKAEKVVTKVTDAQLSINCQQEVVGLEIAVQHLSRHPISQSPNQHGPIRRRKRRYILMTDQSDAGIYT